MPSRIVGKPQEIDWKRRCHLLGEYIARLNEIRRRAASEAEDVLQEMWKRIREDSEHDV